MTGSSIYGFVMVAPVTSSTSTVIADNENTGDINVTSFGTPFLDVESVQLVTNLAPNGVNEGLRLRRTTSVSTGEQYAGGTSFTSADFTGQIVYTSRRAKEGGINGEDFANGGYGCFMRDTSGNFRAWRFGGNDDGYDNDVMRTRVIDPEVTGDEIEDAGFDLTAVDAFGYYFTADRVSTNDAEWQILQTFYASDITVTRGDSTTPATWNDLADEMDNNAGDYDQVFMDKIGGNLYRGVAKYIIGANDSNEHRFDQNSWALEFFQAVNDIYDGGNGERYGAVIQDDSFSITIEVGSNFYLNWQNFVLRGIKQFSFEVNGNSNTGQTCNFTSGAIAGIGTNDFEAPANFQRCSFDDCDKLIINDATFNNGVISNPADGTCCQITTSSDIDNTSFETDTSTDYAIEITAAGSYALNGVTYSGFTTDINVTATTGTVTIVIGGGGDTPTTQTAGATVNVSAPTNTYTLNSDTASTLIRYFEDDSQTIVDSTTGTSLVYEFPDTDPIDAEFVKQSYVPVNRQDLTPVNGASLDIIMDFDESYNSAHGLVITTD